MNQSFVRSINRSLLLCFLQIEAAVFEARTDRVKCLKEKFEASFLGRRRRRRRPMEDIKRFENLFATNYRLQGRANLLVVKKLLYKISNLFNVPKF